MSDNLDGYSVWLKQVSGYVLSYDADFPLKHDPCITVKLCQTHSSKLSELTLLCYPPHMIFDPIRFQNLLENLHLHFEHYMQSFRLFSSVSLTHCCSLSLIAGSELVNCYPQEIKNIEYSPTPTSFSGLWTLSTHSLKLIQGASSNNLNTCSLTDGDQDLIRV